MEKKSKLILSVLQGDDYDNTVSELNKAGFFVTMLSSTGGFLKKLKQRRHLDYTVRLHIISLDSCIKSGCHLTVPFIIISLMYPLNYIKFLFYIIRYIALLKYNYTAVIVQILIRQRYCLCPVFFAEHFYVFELRVFFHTTAK